MARGSLSAVRSQCEDARVQPPRPLSRRELLEIVAIIALSPACKSDRKPAAGSGSVSAGSAGTSAGSATTPKAATSLDAAAYRTLEAATARILPADGMFPGAREAKVIDFIDRQLAIAPLSRVAPAMIALARALDDEASTRKAAEFAKLPVADQDQVIESLAATKLGTKLPERELFRLLHGLVLEGFFADPHHGGNHEMIAWRAIGFPEPSLRTVGGGHDHGKPG